MDEAHSSDAGDAGARDTGMNRRNATRARALVGSSTRARAVVGLRICIVVGCTTKISMYNHADTCFLHTEPVASEAGRRR